MHWNRPLFPVSLKTRTAVAYAGLFLISFAVIFGVVFLYLFFGDREDADRKLAGIFSECEYGYLTGGELPAGLIPIPKLRRIPEPVRRRIARELGGFQPILAFRAADNARRFTLIGSRERELWSVTVDGEAQELTKNRIDPPKRDTVSAGEFAGESFGGGDRIYFLLSDRTGKMLAHSPFTAADLERFRRHPYAFPDSRIQYADLVGARRRIRVAYRRLPDGNRLVIGLDRHAADENLERIVNAFLIVGLTVFGLSALCGRLLASRMVRGMERVGCAADRIAAGDYSLRVPTESEGLETDKLIASFNTMTENTETLMRELRTIADDIAHDLRTPLTRMLGRSEVTVSGPPSLARALDTLGDNAEDCRRMLALINQMLDISRTESGATELRLVECDLAALLNRSADLFRMAAEQKRQTLSVEIPAGPVVLRADPMRVQQLIANLLDNALKFTPEGGGGHRENHGDAGGDSTVCRRHRLRNFRGRSGACVQAFFPGGREPEYARQRAGAGDGSGGCACPSRLGRGGRRARARKHVYCSFSEKSENMNAF